jgi:hypothetical protein
MTASDIIEKLNLAPLQWEGDWFARSWTSPEKWNSTEQAAGSAIYYLITPNNFSTLHKVTTDEVFHFYKGDPCQFLIIYPNGHVEQPILGNDLESGQHPQIAVPKNCWQGLKPIENNYDYSLMGATLAPEFIWEDFEHGNKDLLKEYPEIPQIQDYLAK